MRDFTLNSYKNYINIVKERGLNVITFNELLSFSELPEQFFIIRHDFDRRPKNALSMAILESKMGIRSTYYFRSKSHVFKPEIILSIRDLGHDIGYHYECLSDSKGDIEEALNNFEKNLEMFSSICSVKTISMHGRPLSPYNNLGMWEVNGTHQLIKEKFKLLGEINFDVDYSDIAYLNDTGRNWSTTKNNIRDHVKSNISLNINSSDQLVNYLSNTPHKRIVFQIHPERWSKNFLEWHVQWLKDYSINLAKGSIGYIKSFDS